MGTRVSSQRSSNASQNIYHDAVVRALIAEGWTITHDPLTLSYGGKDLFVDLGAERVTLAAEKTGQRIAVEIQSFSAHPRFVICRKPSASTKSTGPSWRRPNQSDCSSLRHPCGSTRTYFPKDSVSSSSRDCNCGY